MGRITRLTHGHSLNGKRTPEYSAWLSMRARCRPGKAKFIKHYFGRGIRVCDRWQSFENFLADIGPRPPGMTLERIDNEKGYSPENCRWATWAEQSANKRPTRWVTIDGERMALKRAAQRLGINYGTVIQRVNKHGWTPEEAIATPIGALGVRTPRRTT